ncbi:MAG: hypothetical protein AAF927_03080 [Bacteroidota bacterium]
MAIKYFSALSSEEISQLTEAPAVIAVLIAGADDNIDKKEKSWATRLVHYRTFTSDPKLHEYYETVNVRFEGHLDSLVESWTAEKSEAELSARVSALNPILAKLDAEYADLLRESWRSMARKVAEASGGLVGIGSINKEEAALVDLPMLD